MGTSQQVTVSNRSSVYFSGNNVRPRADLTRRVLIADLDRKMERPETYKFASDPVKAVLADRGKYVAAVLTICRAYIQAGKPDQGLEPLSGFDDWSEMVRSPLVWLGEADPVETLKAARENDPEAEMLAQFLNAAKKHISGAANAKTAAEIIAIGQNGSLIGSGAPITHDPDLEAAVEAICGGSHRVDASKLGARLRNYRNRVCGGLRLERQLSQDQDLLSGTSFSWGVHEVVAGVQVLVAWHSWPASQAAASSSRYTHIHIFSCFTNRGK